MVCLCEKRVKHKPPAYVRPPRVSGLVYVCIVYVCCCGGRGGEGRGREERGGPKEIGGGGVAVSCRTFWYVPKSRDVVGSIVSLFARRRWMHAF